MTPRKRRRVGSRWRLLAWERGRKVALESDGAVDFDELVVEGLCHLERMDHRAWSVWLGDCLFAVHVRRDGTAHVLLVEGALDGAL